MSNVYESFAPWVENIPSVFSPHGTACLPMSALAFPIAYQETTTKRRVVFLSPRKTMIPWYIHHSDLLIASPTLESDQHSPSTFNLLTLKDAARTRSVGVMLFDFDTVPKIAFKNMIIGLIFFIDDLISYNPHN